MTAGHTVLLVAGIVALVGGVQAAIWIPLVGKLHRIPDALRAELAGEQLVHGPDRASFHGATAEYGRVGGIGVLALTDRRLAFRRAVGKPIDVPADQLVGLHEAKLWRGRRTGGRVFLILRVKSGAELGFIVADHAGWKAAFERAIAARSA